LMFKLSFFKSIRIKSRFSIALITFFIVNVASFHYESKFKLNLNLHTKAVRTLEQLNSTVFKARHLISKYHMMRDSKNSSEGINKGYYLNQIVETNEKIKKLVNDIKGLKTEKVLGIEYIRDIFFDSSWRIDESIIHFNKIIESYVKASMINDTEGKKDQEVFFQSSEEHGRSLIKSLLPIKKENIKNEGLYSYYISLCEYISRFSIFLMTLAVYYYLYRPWKEQIYHFTEESRRLKEILLESELKGNIYSWELNYYTKEIKHSKHLASIFNLVDDSEFAYLYDELSSFVPEARDEFLESIEDCVHKNEDLEITVKVIANNKKSYWLNYSAKKREKEEGIWLIGTVRDVTAEIVAKKRFDDLFNEVNLPLVIFGEGQVKDFNNAAKKFFGVEDDGYKMLHPAVMFPLYQEDGRSSLEKLSHSLENLEDGFPCNDNWSFHTQLYGTISAKTTIFDITYDETKLHLMIISDNRDFHDLELRLLDAQRKAQFSKRSKIEYILKNELILDELVNSIQRMSDNLNRKSEYLPTERKIDLEILENVKVKLENNWKEAIHQPSLEGHGLIIFNLEEVLGLLEKKWRRMLKVNQKLQVKTHFDKKYFWGDILKVKSLLMGIVENALETGAQGDIEVNLHLATTNFNKEMIKVEISHSNEKWPGEEWVNLSMDKQLTTVLNEKITPKKILNLIEYLEGDLELHKSSKGLIHEGKISFSFTVKSVHGKMFIGQNDLYFMMNREEYFVPYHESAVSSTDIWTQFGGDWDLIETSIKDFINFYPQVISDIQLGIDTKDGDIIYNAASELYGVLTHFPFFLSVERVVLIQKYGEYLKFHEIQNELNLLIDELTSFTYVLEEFLPSSQEQKIA